MADLKVFETLFCRVDVVAKKRRKGEVIEVDREILLDMLQRVEELEKKLGEIETRFAKKER